MCKWRGCCFLYRGVDGLGDGRHVVHLPALVVDVGQADGGDVVGGGGAERRRELLGQHRLQRVGVLQQALPPQQHTAERPSLRRKTFGSWANCSCSPPSPGSCRGRSGSCPSRR